MAHTKFGVDISKLCRDTALGAVWYLSSKFVDALNKKHLPAWSEDNPLQIW